MLIIIEYITKTMDFGLVLSQEASLEVVEGVPIACRTSDGYVNATQLCNSGGKLYKNWNKSQKTKEFLEELEVKLGMTRSELIKYEMNGSTDRATWVHPQVAINIAHWVKGRKIVRVEDEIQLSLYKEIGGSREVKTKYGIIDILTDTEIIEVKCCKNWKQALGQILIYSLEYPDHKKRIHLFDHEGYDIEDIREVYANFQVDLTMY